MSTEIDISREIMFTDYEIVEEARIEVVVGMFSGRPLANLRMPSYPLASFPGMTDVTEPDLLRSLAACLNAAAAEMEKLGAGETAL